MRYLKKPVKGGPRTEETAALWTEGQALLFPGDAIARLRTITEAFDQETARAKDAAKAYYESGFRIISAGAPMRCAAFVKNLRNRNRMY